ncbi:unnamed protein product [Mytilus edulis]|uniref:Uncharacterized protein n=1 Tax=Mytilus edulis TaxID=6550 RepID=A0A8S3QVS9_MYTED|nr:unnamed protein product [Mytilus edulis]
MSLVDGTEEDVRQSWSDLDTKNLNGSGTTPALLKKGRKWNARLERSKINTQLRILDVMGPLSVYGLKHIGLRKKIIKEKAMLVKTMPDSLDFLNEKKGKKALAKSKGQLFGNKFLKSLAKENKDNKELREMLLFSNKKKHAAGAHKQPAVCGRQTSSPSTSFREETLAGKPVTEQTGEQLWGKSKSFPTELELNYKRSLGSPVCKRNKIRFLSNTFPKSNTKSSLFQSRESGFDKQRNNRTFEQEGHNTVFPNKGFVHKQHFSGTKEGRGSKTCYKSKRPKCFFTLRTFQNGGNSFVKRSSFEERLDGKNRPNRCIFDIANSKRTQKIPQIFLAGKNNGIQVPPVWDCSSPKNIHKTDEGSHDFIETFRCTSDSLPRRYSNNESVKSENFVRSLNSFVNIKGLRFSDQYKQVSNGTFTNNGVSGLYSKLKVVDFVSPEREGRENKEQFKINARTQESVSKRFSSVDRSVNSNQSSCPSRSSALSQFTNIENKSPAFGGHYDHQIQLNEEVQNELHWWLEARSPSESGRCPSPILERDKGLCFSPVLSNKYVSSESSGGKQSDNSDNSSLAIPGLVPSVTSNVSRLSSVTSHESQHCIVSHERATPTDSEQNIKTSRVDGLRRSFNSIGISEETKELLLGSWKSGTRSSYDSAWNKWSSWCSSREIDPFSAPLAAILDFLTWMYKEGYQYRTLNVHRSAISSVLPYIDGVPIGQLPIVKQLMKGVLQNNPPLPKYQFSWDLDIVLKYLSALPINKKLDFSVLGKKLSILLALAAPKRISEIARLDRRFMSRNKSSIIFHLPGLSKTQKDCNNRSVKYCKFSKKKLCVISCIHEYELRTEHLRPVSKHEPDPLLRSTKKPFKGLSSQTVGNWIKWVMKEAGIDISLFQAHSCRMVSTSKAAMSGISMDDIMSMADWSNTRTFNKFYFRTNEKAGFADKVLEMNRFDNYEDYFDVSIDNTNYSSVMTLLTEVLVLQGLFTLTKANLELLWPFDSKAYAREVNINNSTQDDSAGCDMTFTNIKPSGFPVKSTAFDGSSHYDIRIEGVAVDDFSFSFWLNTAKQHGTLFHYKADDPNTDLKDIKLWLDTKQIHFARVLQTKTETEICGSSVSEGNWYYISYGIDKGNGKMWMYMDTSKVYDKDESYKDNVIFPVPGTLRVGGMFDNSAGNFEGSITCIGFHSASVPSSSLTKTPCTLSSRSTCK